jgi:hypothetical protein
MKDDAAEGVPPHPLASQCSCYHCRALTGRLDPEPDGPLGEPDPRAELW